MPAIGDEPYQMKQKFPDVYVAVDKTAVGELNGYATSKSHRGQKSSC